MSSTLETLAVIFDFDDTLVPDSTTKLLQEHGMDPKKFWRREVKELVCQGYDPSLAYLRAMLDNIGCGKPLGELTKKDLHDFGRRLDADFYPGLPGLFEDLEKRVKRYKGVDIKFYVISGGLQEVIEGSGIIQKYFGSVYGSQLAGDSDNGVLKYIKRCITFTEKTRYLFEINKGFKPSRTRRNPYLVNENVPLDKRPIPFQNMIYVGDGLTDIPCFSLVQKGAGEKIGGTAFGVFDPVRKRSAKWVLTKLLKTGRVISSQAPAYRDSDALGSLLRATVATRCSEISVKRRAAERQP